jgi:hypothetical protein
VKVSKDHLATLLDQNEYRRHAELMQYPQEITAILERELLRLQEAIIKKESPFQPEIIENWYRMYREL